MDEEIVFGWPTSLCEALLDINQLPARQGFAAGNAGGSYMGTKWTRKLFSGVLL